MLEAQQLAAQRGAATLFDGIDFAVRPGQALLVTGPNGSGKTTLLKIVAGLVQASAGQLRWRGAAFAPFAASVRCTALYIGHSPGLKDELTAEENLKSQARLHGAVGDPTEIRAALRAWALEPQRALPARVLSQGQRRRVGLARLRLIPRPLWILDEPTTALDSAGVETLQGHLARHLAEGGVAVVATHHALVLPAGSQRSLQLS